MKNYRTIALAVLLVLAAVLRLWDFAAPWTDDHRGWGGSFYGNIARNYLKFGYAETKAAPVCSVNPPDAGHFQYYLDHPPMTGWLVSLSFRVFGYFEWAARLVAALCSMGGLILLYLIARRYWKSKIALIATAVAAAAPMAAFYGGFVDVQGPIPFFFILLVFFLYLRFDEKRTWDRWLLVLAAFLLSTLSDWPAYYLVPVILVHHFFSKSAIGRKWRVLLLPAVALAMLVLFVFYINWVQYGEPSFEVSQMAQWFSHRAISTAHEGTGESFTAAGWLGAVQHNLHVMFTLPVLILAVVGLLFYVLRIVAGELDRGDGVLAALLALGLLHIFIFRQGAYVHEFWGYYLYPAIVLLVALCVVRSVEVLFTNSVALRAAFCFVITLAACTASTLGDLNLQRTRSSADYASLGRILSDLVPQQTPILAEEKLPDYWNYRFSFYMSDYVEYARPCAPNFKVARNLPFGAVFLVNLNEEPMPKFKRELIDKYEPFIAVGPAWGGFINWESPKLSEAGVAPPHDVQAVYGGRRLTVRWKHDEPQKVKRFNIYAKSDQQTFYTDVTDNFSFSGANEATVWYELRAPVTIIVTALDGEGRETGFSEEARVSP